MSARPLAFRGFCDAYFETYLLNNVSEPEYDFQVGFEFRNPLRQRIELGFVPFDLML